MNKSFFHHYKSPLLVLVLLILIGGIFSFQKMQTALFPEITFPKIKIIADAGQQPVGQMTVAVTRPLENAIKQVPDLIKIRSITSRGSCEISAFINWKADINLSQQQIESRINQIRSTLPADVNIVVEKMNPSILPIIGYSVNSKERSPIELKQMALYTIKPFLSQVAGISDVRIIGGKSKEYWVILNQEKMSQLGLNPAKLSQALNQTNFVKSNGYLSDYRLLYLTVTNAQITNAKQLGEMIVQNDGKRAIQLKDIAKVEIHEAKEYIKVNANGKESLLIAVIKQPNSNLVDVSKAMTEKVAELQKILPSDVTIKPYYVQADFVNDAVKSVTDSLWIGLALAIFVAILFLRSWKASLTILITIPVTLALTLIVLYFTGETFNIMTLGAIAAAIGLIIDDAIVIVEQIHRTHEEHPEEPTKLLVHKAINYLFKAMVGSSISTIVIFLPFVLMSGVAGAYFKVMTNTMIITLVCSFFSTWILLPVVYLFLTKESKKSVIKEDTHVVKERKWVGFFIRKPIISFAFMVLLVASVVLILPKLETGFLPAMDEGSIVLDYDSPPGTNLEETDRMLKEVEKLIVKVPEVAAYSRRTGTQMGFFITEPNRGDYLIQLKKDRSRTTDQVIDDIRQQIEASQPALRIDFGQVIGDMLGDLMSSVQPIEIKVFGPDQKKIQAYSKQIGTIVENVNGTADVFDGVVIAGPSITVLPDYNKLAQFNISPADFQYQIQNDLEGNVGGNIYDKQQLTPIRFINSTEMKGISGIRQMNIFLPNGSVKPIAEFATIQVNKGEAELERENLQTMGVISARLNNRDLGSTVAEIQKKINNQVALEKGYSVSYGGAYADQQQSFKELLLILCLSSLLVFSVMLFLFRDIRVAGIILLVAVLGISGSYIFLFFTNTPLNVGSYTGLIMMVGIIGENAIFTYLQYSDALKEMDQEKAVIYAISTRLRPKLMTALGAIIALMPLALGIGTGAQLHQPLAIAVIGGFIVALPLLLIVLPTLLNMIKPKLIENENIDR
ncbi:MAG: efflux RND transporter permease subunit [Bacteroidetes bacterium]|nr:efflux RND transporter permease subunit [Bacteroidota bacterium]MBU1484075.1 efflux RND transporter permease subunit [Bacteroidota bacterium]MBU1760453.1 efflux RND transporter permease subunit [Bacteroidota bacterium]MBU2376242.1 efflux RND transporter permease subunit [Bacteroidota bacterium]